MLDKRSHLAVSLEEDALSPQDEVDVDGIRTTLELFVLRTQELIGCVH